MERRFIFGEESLRNKCIRYESRKTVNLGATTIESNFYTLQSLKIELCELSTY